MPDKPRSVGKYILDAILLDVQVLAGQITPTNGNTFQVQPK